MTISKERFGNIVVELVEGGDGARQNDWSSHIDFAHALIQRVEAESDPIIRHHNGDGSISDYVELPLVGE